MKKFCYKMKTVASLFLFRLRQARNIWIENNDHASALLKQTVNEQSKIFELSRIIRIYTKWLVKSRTGVATYHMIGGYVLKRITMITILASAILISKQAQAGNVTFIPTYEPGSAWIGNTVAQTMVQNVFNDFSTHLKTSGDWDTTIEVYLTDNASGNAYAVPDGWYTSVIDGKNYMTVNAFRQIVDGVADPNGPIQPDGTNNDITIHFNVSAHSNNAGLLRHEMMHGLGAISNLPWPRMKRVEGGPDSLLNTGAGSSRMVSAYDRLLYDINDNPLLGTYNSGNSQFTINDYVTEPTQLDWTNGDAGVYARGIDDAGSPVKLLLGTGPYGNIADNVAQLRMHEMNKVMYAGYRSDWDHINDDDRSFLRALGYSIISFTGPPVIVCPADTTVDCTSATDTTTLGVATAMDNCALDSISFTDTYINTNCTDTIYRMWIAVDSCGNADTCTQTIIIQDTAAPVITCPSDTTVDCTLATDTTTLGAATAIDNCALDSIAYSDVIAQGSCPQDYTITRTWTAVDSCGNSISCDQLITVQDTTPPVIVCPANTIVNYTSATDTTTLGAATATDNCVLDSIFYSDIITAGACPQNYTITRTWTAVDSCGNSISCDQIITVQDTTPPVIVCPADTTVDCTSATDITTLGVATATDNCALDSISFTDTYINTNCTDTIYRMWIAVDSCGNADTCTQTIIIQDTAAPVITCPSDTTVDCTSATDTTTLGAATAIDNCALDSIAYSDVITVGVCPQNYTITRTWTAVDSCGNSISCDQLITVQDTTPPVIVCPANTIVNYTSATDTTTLGAATATDNCVLDSIFYSDIITAGACPQNYTITRTWTAVDSCGNSISCDQIITVQDTTPPVIVCPVDTIVDCTSATDTATLGTAIAQDSIFYTDVITAGVCPQNYTITRTWTAVDSCGNSISCDQIITVRDTTPPVIVCPADTTVDCTSATDITTLGVATATDNCALDSISFTDTYINTNCTDTIYRMWIAVDSCGNADTCTQTIIIQDTAAPVITCPSDTTVDCTSATDTTTLGAATAIDNCVLDSIAYSDVITVGVCPKNYTITRTWTAVDSCGNSISCDQLITVQDTTPPVIVCPANTIVNYTSATDTTTLGAATATDNCVLDSIFYSDIITAGACPQNYTITRTWTAVDSCGNSTSCDQIITVQDTTPPVIVCPVDTIVDCTSATDTVTLGTAIAQDSIFYTDVITAGVCPQNYTITRTWTAVDSCGNSTSCDQIITVRDTTPPVIVCPANTIVNYTSATDTTTLGAATATDNCVLDSIFYSDIITAGACPQNYTITRTWTAVDSCGNSTSCDQIITVQDTTPPVIVCPVDTIVDCTSTTDTATLGTAIAQDSIFYTDVITVGTCPQNYTITRTWTVVDSCGNSISCDQIITVQDTTPPVIVCPADTTVDCTSATDITTLGVATATDNCALDSISFTDTYINTNCTDTIYRMWIAVDSCGNADTCTQTIIIQDTAAPVITCPSDTTVDCTSATDTTTLGAATAIDNCALDSIAYSDVITVGVCPQNYTITRTWTAVDSCGNSISCDQIITVRDTTPPVIVCPADTTVDCTSASDVTTLGVATATDNCALDSISFTDTYINTNCTDTIYRMWIAVDSCGNADTCTQTIIIQDTAAPVIVCPSDTTVGCTSATDTTILGAATAIDNCALDSIAYSDVITQGSCPQDYTITRTWTAVDSCGNSVSCDQIITVQDTTPPVIVCPADTTVDCTSATDITTLGVATATDNCALDSISFTDTYINTNCTDTIYRMWIAVDSCGNADTCTQTIIIQDTAAPVITCPSDTTVDCTSATDATTLGAATAIDNCALDSIAYSDVITQGSCPQDYTITRTWTAVDSCGNSISCDQIITVRDTTPPVIVCPADTTVDCTSASDVTTLGVATATDNCALDSISFTDTYINTNCTDTIYRMWIAVDSCGNADTCTQTIIIQDTAAPVITCPSDTTVDCTSATDTTTLGAATAIDNCALDSIAYSDVITQGSCPQDYTITRTWTAVDSCGNSISCDQLITVRDTTPPVIVCSDVTLSLDANGLLSIDVSTINNGSVDGCGIDTIYLDTYNFDCTNVGGNTVTLTTVDSCGNISICQSIVIVQISTACIPIDTIHVVVPQDSTTTVCLETTQLAGTIKSMTSCDDPNNVMTINSVPYCVDITSSIVGNDTTCVVICDDLGFCDTTIIVISVTPIEIDLISPPIAVDDRFEGQSNEQISGDILLNDSDPENEKLTITKTLISSPSNGILVLLDEGNFIYTPNTAFIGTDQFSYKVCDPTGLCDTAIVYLNIECPFVDEGNLFIPQLVTPNGDKKNDEWIVEDFALLMNCYESNEVIVFNRWGEKVYQKKNYGTDGEWWDGYSTNSLDLKNDELVLSGTYFYIITLNGDKQNALTGFIHVQWE